MKINESLLCMN